MWPSITGGSAGSQLVSGQHATLSEAFEAARELGDADRGDLLEREGLALPIRITQFVEAKGHPAVRTGLLRSRIPTFECPLDVMIVVGS